MNTTSAPVEVVPAGAPDRLQSAAARRLQRRSRAVWVSCALVVIIVVAAALATELVLSALGRPALLVAPDAVRSALTEGGTTGAIVAAAAALFGIVCLWGALAPGRTHRRALAAGRVPLVVDDAIVAGALSRAPARPQPSPTPTCPRSSTLVVRASPSLPRPAFRSTVNRWSAPPIGCSPNSARRLA